ncbi:Photosystem I reaction center subunit PsaK [[Leptolyngbya] sp. PCC 7376]|uniref:photosystem I reaction center subunit PsaK n=1 Tax=[Leptolyngbya] sp. PCC 7376 TaxID=111781 RepID=UPI00029EE650|nr:photosystem I reaction center subunit PsaK [[Leptolyngbya] sp. PCC 7376]AFY39147.1 Photosystem I reaction center subunit PsaK [[Leptolyngbya] sp. PCC 7376]
MSLVLTLAAAVPPTLEWSPKVAVVMIICNILAIALGKATIKNPSAGPALPMPEMFGGMGFPALLATTSLGHVIGVGAILGLASAGAI